MVEVPGGFLDNEFATSDLRVSATSGCCEALPGSFMENKQARTDSLTKTDIPLSPASTRELSLMFKNVNV